MIERLSMKGQRGRPRRKEKILPPTVEFKDQKQRLYRLFLTYLEPTPQGVPTLPKEMDQLDTLALLNHFQIITEAQYKKAQSYLWLYYKAHRSMGLKTHLKSQLGSFERLGSFRLDKTFPYWERRWTDLQEKLNTFHITRKPLGSFLRMIVTSPLQTTLLQYSIKCIKQAFQTLENVWDL
jgi:hypothetical protein